MRDSGVVGASAPSVQLAWKLAIAAILLLAVLFGVPGPGATLVYLAQAVLLLWGAGFVAVVAALLSAAGVGKHWLTAALAVGAYGALAVPPVVTGDLSKMVEAVGPVVALTLAAQLSRRDLPAAMHDWALVVGVALFGALGVQALWLVLGSFGPALFAVGVLLPAVALELALLLLRPGRLPSRYRYALAVLLAVALSTLVMSFTQYNAGMQLGWRLFFNLVAGLLTAAALAISLGTRRSFETGPMPGGPAARAFVELTHSAFLVALPASILLSFLMR